MVGEVRPTGMDTKDIAVGSNRAMEMDNSHKMDFRVAAVTFSSAGAMGVGVADLCSARYLCSAVEILVLATRMSHNMGTTSIVVPPQWFWVPPLM